MSKDKFFFGGQSFKYKKDVKAYVQDNMLYNFPKYPGGAALDRDDLLFMLDLLANHHAPDKKIGPGVKEIVVRQQTDFQKKYREFFVVRIDGTEANFSYLKCIYPESDWQRFVRACREAAHEDVEQFKIKALDNGPVHCPLTGELLDQHNSHVDHEKPKFRDLVELFTTGIGTSKTEILCEDNMGCHHKRRFKDPSVRQKFKDFHMEKASLRLLSKKANLELG